MIELLFLPLVAGMVIALLSGPLGCFVVWNRMAYFGDTLAHSALLGVGLAFILEIHPQLGIFLSCLFVAVALLFFKSGKGLPKDTLLGILAHGFLAAGIVLASLNNELRLDLMAFLFGDILAVNTTDIAIIVLVSACIAAYLLYFWRELLLSSMDQDLAQVENSKPQFHQGVLLFLLAFLIAVSIKIVGVLLIAAMLIIPAATARLRANNPISMAIMASLYAITAVIGGLFLSWFVDSPAGPSIVLFCFLLFILNTLLSYFFTPNEQA